MKIHLDSIHPWLFAQRKSQLAKRQQWVVMQIMCDNKGRKGQDPLVLLSLLTLGPQTLSKK